ncbi:hypothetical protein ACOSQ3_020235 [Xanthoceras sorbifolium]
MTKVMVTGSAYKCIETSYIYVSSIHLPSKVLMKISKLIIRRNLVVENRDLQPTHFTLKIESYSLLANASNGQGERYESGIFDVGGYKWKLVLYPQGKKGTCDGKDHVSLYLAIDVSSNSFSNTDNWTVCVNLKLFVLNQKTKKYMTIQEANKGVWYFDDRRTEHGFDQFLSHEEFNDPCNGYLVDDCCAFGTEVLVILPSSGSEETLTMVKQPARFRSTHTWSIENYSKITEDSKYSDEFSVGGRKWKLFIYPKGDEYGKDKSISLYLMLADWESFVPKRKVYAKYKLRVVDHSRVKKGEYEASIWFDNTNPSWGFDNLIPIADVNELSNGYLKDDTLIAEVEFDVISQTKVRP